MHAISKTITDTNRLIINQSSNGIQLIEAAYANPYKKQAGLISVLDLPFNVYFLNLQSEAQIVNHTNAQVINLSSVDDALGLSVWDLTTKEAAQRVIQHDQLVMQSKKMIVCDESYISDDGIEQAFLTIKYPWYNNQLKLIGVFGLSLPLGGNPATLANYMNMLNEKGLFFSSSYQTILPGIISLDTYFTESEKNIISLLIRGKSAREIGLILKRSRRTIESHIENLKIKTKSSCKSELIEKLMTI